MNLCCIIEAETKKCADLLVEFVGVDGLRPSQIFQLILVCTK